jgi:hypothetical protein
VLDGVLRLLVRAEHVAAEAEDAAVVAVEDDLEGGLVAAPDPFDESLVGQPRQQTR